MIERTRPRLVSRCGLRKDRNCVPRAALNERHPHRTCVPNATKYETITLDPHLPRSCEARGSAHRGPRGGVPRGEPYAHGPACTRCAMGFCRKGKAPPHLHTRAARTRHGHTPTAPPAHTTGRARGGGCPHYGGSAKPTAHCAAAHAHSHTDTTSRPGGDYVDGGHSKTTRNSTCAPSSCYLGDV